MSDKEKAKIKIQEEKDFIYSPKFNNSLENFTNKYDNGVEDDHAAKVLLMTEEQFKEEYAKTVKTLQKEMLDEQEED
jgi:menaquinone-dependent protoporphyrinogen IX oxidase